MAEKGKYTLIEIIVILLVIAVTVAIIFPYLLQLRENEKKMTCQNNLRRLAIALHNYTDLHDGMLPLLGTCSKKTMYKGKEICYYNYPRINSVVELMPFMEMLEEAEAVLTLPCSVVACYKDRPVFSTIFPELVCPADPAPPWPFVSNGQVPEMIDGNHTPRNYVFCTGDYPDAGCYHYEKGTDLETFIKFNNNTRTAMPAMSSNRKFSDILDGTSLTIFLGERCRGIKESSTLIASTAYGTSLVVGPAQSPLNTSPQNTCDIAARIRIPYDGTWSDMLEVHGNTSGTRAFCANPPYSTFQTLMSPNTPSCVSGYDGRSCLSLSSYHPNGAFAATYDGSVSFISDDINTSSTNLLPVVVDQGPSQYGVWGAKGSIAGAEQKSL